METFWINLKALREKIFFQIIAQSSAYLQNYTL